MNDSTQVTAMTSLFFLRCLSFFHGVICTREIQQAKSYMIFFFFTYHSRNSNRVIFVRVTVVYAYLLFTDRRILPITSLVGTDNTEIHAFM